ncbi:MAG: hypothetical protein RL258_1489 [Pseudomonadota bacterium]
MVFLMPQYAFFNLLLLVFKPVVSRKPALGLFFRDLKVGRQSAQVGIRDDNTWIAAAVGGAFAAVVLVLGLF